MLDALYNINFPGDGDAYKVNRAGNIIYLIGPSGTGKTTLTKAIGQVILKHPDKTFLLIDAGYIKRKIFFADQLFRTVSVKTIGKNKRETSGVYDEEKEAPILDHILNWGEAVGVLDDYDKMKLLRFDPGPLRSRFSRLYERFQELPRQPNFDDYFCLPCPANCSVLRQQWSLAGPHVCVLYLWKRL